jgi:hypothetical protein
MPTMKSSPALRRWAQSMLLDQPCAISFGLTVCACQHHCASAGLLGQGCGPLSGPGYSPHGLPWMRSDFPAVCICVDDAGTGVHDRFKFSRRGPRIDAPGDEPLSQVQLVRVEQAAATQARPIHQLPYWWRPTQSGAPCWAASAACGQSPRSTGRPRAGLAPPPSATRSGSPTAPAATPSVVRRAPNLIRPQPGWPPVPAAGQVRIRQAAVRRVRRSPSWLPPRAGCATMPAGNMCWHPVVEGLPRPASWPLSSHRRARRCGVRGEKT